MSESLLAALAYAKRGWPLFPLHGVRDDGCTCGPKDCSSPGKHPLTRHGLKDATVDLEVIRKWWARWPEANIGVATGHPTGIVVVDIDLPLALDSLDRVIHKLPSTLTGLSGGGGVHLIYRGGRALRCTCSRLPGIPGELPGIDLRAEGGYVVAPPSLHVSGNRYEWLEVSGRPQVDDVHDDDERKERPARPLEGLLRSFVHIDRLTADIVDAPAWLREPPRHDTPALAPCPPRYSSGDGTAYGLKALDNALASLRCTPIGQRNHTLNRVAFRMARLVSAGHLEEHATRSGLRSTAVAIGLTEHESCLTIASAFSAGLRPGITRHRLKQ